MNDIPRTPWAWVIRQLRQAVGFRCPFPGCGLPYLTWHHFDPPWNVEHHHRPDGMIALCGLHAARADAGTYTNDQLRELKRIGRSRAEEISGEFDWMRNDLLAVVGGNFYHDNGVLIQVDSTPIVWFNRDENNELLLNFSMPSEPGTPERASIRDNVWVVPPDIADLECAFRGRTLEVRYPDRDRFRIEYNNFNTFDDLQSRYPNLRADFLAQSTLRYPLTVVEMWHRIGRGRVLDVGPLEAVLSPTNFLTGSFFERNGVGIQIISPPAR